MAKRQRGVYEREPGSGKWSICYFDQFGKERNEVVGSYQSACRMYNKRKNEVREGKFDPAWIKGKHHMTTVAELLDDYISNCEFRSRKSIDDIRQRGTVLKGYFANCSAKAITPRDIARAFAELKKTKLPSNNKKVAVGQKADSTVNRYKAILKSAYILGIENGKVERQPFTKRMILKENNEIVRYLSEDEEQRLFQALPKEYHCLATVALHTGLRTSEQLNLKWEDVDFHQKLIYIHNPKSGKDQTIPMRDIVIETLLGIVRVFNNSFVFPGRGTERRKKTIENRFWKKYIKQAGIENFRWHDLRHTFASRLVMAGVDIYTVARLLRHSSVEVTKRYAHLAPEYLQEQINRPKCVQHVQRVQLAQELAQPNSAAS